MTPTFGIRNDSPVFHEYFKKCFEDFFKLVKVHQVKNVIHLGDLYERRKYVNFATAKLCREYFLNPLEENGIDTHILVGNHDLYYKDTHEVNSLTELIGSRYRSIKIHDTPTTINLDGLDILLLPWITETNSKQSFDAISTTHAEICMGHLELNGFEMFKGMVSDHGMDKNLFSKFDMVFSGHYHHKSSVGNIHYLGAFGEYTWSDYNDPRGFHFFDTNTRKLTFVKNPYTMFNMIAYDDVKHPDIIEKINATDYGKYKDAYVKVVCVNKTNQYAFDLMMDKLYKSNPVDISIVEDISTFTDNGEDVSVDETQDTGTILSKYIENLTLPVPSDRMIKYMKDIYQEALSMEHV